MKKAKLERLLDLLGELHEDLVGDGETRDEISHVRFVIEEKLDEEES